MHDLQPDVITGCAGCARNATQMDSTENGVSMVADSVCPQDPGKKNSIDVELGNVRQNRPILY